MSSIVSGRSMSDRRARVLRPLTYTVAPETPSSMAMPRPPPRVAPATTATRPASGRAGEDGADGADGADDGFVRAAEGPMP